MDAENSLPHDLGSGGRPCRFESCYPQPKGLSQNAAYTRYVAATDRVRTPYPVYSGYFATAPFALFSDSYLSDSWLSSPVSFSSSQVMSNIVLISNPISISSFRSVIRLFFLCVNDHPMFFAVSPLMMLFRDIVISRSACLWASFFQILNEKVF